MPPINLTPIDPVWAQQTFPSVFSVFRKRDLVTHVEAFNCLVSERQITTEQSCLIPFLLEQREHPSAPTPLLLALSANGTRLSADFRAPMVGRIVHLEDLLTRSLAAGVKVSEYRSMLRSPSSLMDLLAELDIACALRRADAILLPHAEGRAGSASNYDIHATWERPSAVLHGEGKRYDDFLTRKERESMFSAHVLLAKPDLAHALFVKASRHCECEDHAIAAVEETLRLYEAALTGEAGSDIYLAKGKHEVTAILNPNRFVESVKVRLDLPFLKGQGHALLFGPMDGSEQDLATVTGRLRDASGQLPERADPDHATAIFVTAHDFVMAEEVVREALEGDLLGTKPGLFSGPDLTHVDGAILFCHYHQASHRAECVVSRVARVFTRPGISDRRGLVLERAARALRQPSSYALPARTSGSPQGSWPIAGCLGADV